MEQKYKRIEDLDQKIKKLSMPYLEWKVLFLVADGTSAGDITDYITEKKGLIEKTLTALEEKGLIEKLSADEVSEPEEKIAEEVPEIDLQEEELEPAPIEDETKIQVTQVEEPEDEEIDFEQEEAEVEDDKTMIPDLVEEDSQLQEAAEEVEKEEIAISEEEFMQEMEAEAVPEPETVTESKQEEIVSGSGAKSIMVIDDSIVIRKMIEIALEDEDFRILSATSGKEGMEAVERDNPDLIILDMLLPDMNGIDVLKKIKESKKLPVIMLSGKDSPQLVENAKEAGVNDFLPKPFKDEELVEKVKALIG